MTGEYEQRPRRGEARAVSDGACYHPVPRARATREAIIGALGFCGPAGGSMEGTRGDSVWVQGGNWQTSRYAIGSAVNRPGRPRPVA